MRIPRNLASRWRVLQRLKLSQYAGRLRLRWRQQLVKQRGLAAVPRRRTTLATDWLLRIKKLSSSERCVAAWQAVPGCTLCANARYLETGAGRGLRWSRDLGQLELFYHEFLVEHAIDSMHAWNFLENYLRSHAMRTGDSQHEWHPYAVSNRLANWLRFLAAAAPENLRVAERIAEECMLLTDYVEWCQERDIEANHLLKNLWAIAVSDTLLCPDLRLARKSVNNYVQELQRQQLADGAHFELSPMYHAKVLSDATQLQNLIRSDTRPFRELGDCIRKAHQWLDCFRMSRLSWANFNDSWTIPSLADRIWSTQPYNPKTRLVHLHDSGFIRGDGEAGWHWVFDVGGVGPHFNPGHCHSDTLSVALHFGEHPILVDPGPFHYSPNDERAFLKSCHSHNGPCLADSDHTELLGSFRVGRSTSANNITHSEDGTLQTASAGHDGYNLVRIQRTLQVSARRVAIQDRWIPRSGTNIKPWVRLLWPVAINDVESPAIADERLSFSFALPDHKGKIRVALYAEGIQSPRLCLAESFYSTDFGRMLPAVETLVVGADQRHQAELCTELSYAL